VDPNLCIVKFFNKEYQLRRKLNRTELDRFLATLLKRLEVVFDMSFTDRVVKNILCESFRELSQNKGSKQIQMWCDTLQPGQQLFEFKTNYMLVLSPGGKTEEVEGEAIVNRFPYGDRLLTMGKLVAELGLPRVMPSESWMSKYRFYDKVWCPTVKFDVEFTLPQVGPLSKMGLETTKVVLSKWIGNRPIPRKRRRID
jgi:hypothetical protein